jgi:hypothetical protein
MNSNLVRYDTVSLANLEELLTSVFRVHIAEDPETGGSKHLQNAVNCLSVNTFISHKT